MSEQVSPVLPDRSAGIKEGLENLAVSVTRLVGRAWEWITGVPQGVEQAVAYREVWIYAVTSAALFAVIAAVLPAVFGFLARRIRKRRERLGPHDARALVLEAVSKPLALAAWVYGLFFAVLPLLQLLEPGNLLFFLRLLLEKIFDFGLLIAVHLSMRSRGAGPL